MIEFDKELFETMVDMAKDFWNCVQTKTPPALTPDDNTLLSEIFAKPNEEIIKNQDMEEKISKLQQVKDDISALETEQKMLEAEIKNVIGDHFGVITQKFKVTWGKYEKTSVNTNLLKTDGLYDKYSQKTSYRKLNVSELNKDKKSKKAA